MSWMRFFRRRYWDEERARELEAYLEAETDENIARGMPPEEARYAAHRKLGNTTQIREEIYHMNSLGWLDSLWQDVRFALRMLRKNPGFTAVAVLTLALGIGANAAIFSMVNSVLLRPLSYREARQLYVVREVVPELSKTYPTLPANLPNFCVWQRDCRSFRAVAIVKPINAIVTGLGEAERVWGAMGSANLFDVLGIVPELGRTFLPEEDIPGKDHVVILTHAFWRERFHGDRAIVGRSMIIEGAPYQVVGVLPASFRFPRGAQFGTLIEYAPQTNFFKPLGLDPKAFSPIGEFDFTAIARLKPGVSAQQALAELNVVQARITKEANQGLHLGGDLIPLESQVVGSARRGLLLLLGAVGAVLLMVCVNLANLLLVRVPARMREASIRTALGASRARLVQQMLTECSLLALLGGMLGTYLAYFGLRWLVAVAPPNLPRIDEVQVDARVLWFSIVVSGLTGILFGALPAWRVTRTDPQQALKAGAVTVSESRRARRWRESLIGFEVAASTLLLVVAGLLVASMVRLLSVDKGFTTEHVLAADIDLPRQSYRTRAQKEGFYRDVLARVQALPGVLSAGWVSRLPFEGQEQVDAINVPGKTKDLQGPVANYRYVSPGYFQSMGIQLRQGRLLGPADRERHVAVISENAAREVWAGQNALGKTFHVGDDASLTEVVGVVADVRIVALDEPPLLMVYQPIGPGSPKWEGRSASLVVRTATDTATMSKVVRGAICSLDSGVPIEQLRPMRELVIESVGVRRFQMGLVALFAAFALLLTAMGICGVVGYAVARRRQEMGIRMAFGAQCANLRNLVLRQGMAPVLVGWAAGVATAMAAGGLVRSQLFGVTARDSLTILCVSVVVLATAALACYLPAHRAAKVDPMVALRYE